MHARHAGVHGDRAVATYGVPTTLNRISSSAGGRRQSSWLAEAADVVTGGVENARTLRQRRDFGFSATTHAGPGSADGGSQGERRCAPPERRLSEIRTQFWRAATSLYARRYAPQTLRHRTVPCRRARPGRPGGRRNGGETELLLAGVLQSRVAHSTLEERAEDPAGEVFRVQPSVEEVIELRGGDDGQQGKGRCDPVGVVNDDGDGGWRADCSSRAP